MMKLNMFRSRSKDQDSKVNTQPKNVLNENEFLYSKPEVPLDFSFKKLRSIEELRKMEPRKGIRRPIEEIYREEIEKTDKISMKNERSLNLDETESQNNDRSILNREDITNNRNSSDSPNKNIKETEHNKITKSTANKKKVKYITYTNSIILHSNKLNSLENIHTVLNDVVPNLEFSLIKTVSKIDLIQWIDLSHNYIQSIHKDILNLPFLKIFYCHGNLIKEIANVTVLKRCKSLINLSLHGNPIAQIKGYRQYIIEIIPNLEKLDFTLVSEKELDVIHHKSSRNGEKRDKVTGEIIEYPKLDEEIIKRFKSLSEIDD
jgi:hypothetical protein